MHRDSSDEDDLVAMPEPEALARPARLAPRRRLPVRLAIALATVALLGMVLTLAHVPVPSLTNLFHSSFSPPNGWQRYADPDKSFRVWIPPDWTSQVNKTTAGGLCSPGGGGCFNYLQESVLLGATPQDPTAFSMQILVDPIATSTARSWWCRTGPATPNTEVGGVPATHRQASDGHPAWEVFTGAAHFAIQSFGAHSAAEIQVTETVAASFIPETPYPMQCP